MTHPNPLGELQSSLRSFRLAGITLCLLMLTSVGPILAEDASEKADEEGFISLWDGETFENWKINENEDTWSIQDGAIVANGPRSHLFYTGPRAPFKNFELKVDVKASHNSNGGIYFHTKYQDEGWPSAGYETQVNNTYSVDPRKTGSLYAVDDVHEQHVEDDTWWTQHVVVNGNHVVIKVNDKTVTDYTVPEGEKSRIGAGTFALQGHDPGSTVYYKNIRVKPLPDEAAE